MNIIRQSFKRQIFAIFLTVTLILLAITGITTIQGFQARLKYDYEKKDIEQNQTIDQNLESDLEIAETALLSLSGNQTIIEALTTSKNNSLAIYTELYKALREIRDFATVDIYQGSECKYSTNTKSVSKELPLNYSVLREASANSSQIVYSLDPTTSSETGAALLMVKQIVGGETPGFVIIRFEKSELEKRLRTNINAKDGFMLTDKYLRPFCLIGTAEDGNELDVIRDNLFNGQPYNANISNNVYMDEIGSTGLIGIYITPPALGEAAATVSYQILFIEIIFSVVICLIVASRLSVYFSKPINTLALGMKRFRKGDFDTKIELNRDDEFEQLAVGFNKMTSQLKQTMDERVQAERTINETRIQMMQAQLNPHFLYNTLDTIKWVAKANNVPEVATMSASLAGILRTSISEHQFCRLSKELELIENYCEIQKIRFEDKFDLTIDVPEEIKEAVIPKLILQPIVENAIIHGMDETENGHIYVAAVKNTLLGQDVLKISIQDDGKGISDEMMQALNNDDVETLKGHLGLNNVNTIIRLYYGKDYGVMAFRPSEGGTVMIVTLPYSEKEPVRTDSGSEK
ncbi:sensor histidine kinase [Butyrivibrio proteoclasticus]|uniref:sensor histidine kinase n=1 Tax=Butyrivibrio proteoclasticus TaxID=43305 RepID=UPI00068613A3|nr:sensor histidine kinase [Butyrivibrio proteoclasticus]